MIAIIGTVQDDCQRHAQIFERRCSWISSAFIHEHLLPNLSAHQIAARIAKAPFVIPTLCRYPDNASSKQPYYRGDFVLALFDLMGKFCLYCLKPLKGRQVECCSRTCVSRYDQNDETDIPMTLRLDAHAALKLLQVGMRMKAHGPGLAAYLLKERVVLEHMQMGSS